MSTKSTVITAKSKIGWAPLGSDKPQCTGTISSIPPPPEIVQWFVGMRAAKGVNYWPIVAAAQVSPEGCKRSDAVAPVAIHGGIMDFLGDFSMQIQYQVPNHERRGGRPKNEILKQNRKVWLSDRAWENIKSNGGSEAVEQWALGLGE